MHRFETLLFAYKEENQINEFIDIYKKKKQQRSTKFT